MMLSISTLLPSWKEVKLERNDHDGGSRLLPLFRRYRAYHSRRSFRYTILRILFLNGGSCRLERSKSFVASRLLAYVFMGLEWVRS
jgi:hypothetical protein